MNHEASGKTIDSPHRSACFAARMARWFASLRLKWEFAHHRRIGDSLSAQIINDVEALAYIRRRQFLAGAKLQELQT